MIWSDRKIKENKHIIEPYFEELVQPNSYDVRLDDVIIVDGEKVNLPYILEPNKFVLASTIEKITLPNGVVAQLDGKSSLARLGFLAHFTAGWCDSGFSGTITLECLCSHKPIMLEKGMKIGQLIFMDAYESDKIYGEYGNHYQYQKGATKSVLE